MFAKVVLSRNIKAIDMAFSYRIPTNMLDVIKKGHKVIVPFSRGNILTEGFVIDFEENCDYKKIKSIHQIIDDFILSSETINLIMWIKKIYLCTFYEAISVVVPSGSKLNRRTSYLFIKEPVRKELTKKQRELLNYIKNKKEVFEKDIKEKKMYIYLKELINNKYIEKNDKFYKDVNIIFLKIIKSNMNKDLDYYLNQLSNRAIKQRKILKFIYTVNICEGSLLTRELNCTKAILTKLESLGFITISKIEKFRKPDILNNNIFLSENELNNEQTNVYFEIKESYKNNKNDIFLLHGVTGSGKTEVYIKLAKRVIKDNKQVIILVPEISLTPQIVSKFIKNFGQNIAIMHSKISRGERFDQYRAIQNGDISIIIGARSAIFSPCENLGLIIIDEEHESSYKSDSNPKYNTVEVAKYISNKKNIPLVLASATPDLNSYYNTEKNIYKLLELKKRFNNNKLPAVSIVDMREELKSGNKSVFSELLIEKINEKLEKKEQIILFYNRKGYSTFVSCRECGYALKCPRCDIALTYHHKDKKAKCSYCDYIINVPEKCPECKSEYFKYFGVGTEKIEEMLSILFPSANIARLDSETTSKKGSLEKIISEVESKDIDILLGTQMVTKGLDFKNVTLVGTLSADMSLNFPDFRASEKTFQLLTQVAGRAGRGEKIGEVIVQTYEPDNYAIKSSIDHDYHKFYLEEKQIREIYGYPPYKNLISILIVGENENDVTRSSFNLHRELERFIYKKIDKKNIEILGPNPAIFQKLNNKYRWQIILKFDKIDLDKVRNIVHYICIKNKDKVVLKNIYISININPMSLL